jgi:hypothetical protein
MGTNIVCWAYNEPVACGWIVDELELGNNSLGSKQATRVHFYQIFLVPLYQSTKHI